jgi:hypothetical protein
VIFPKPDLSQYRQVIEEPKEEEKKIDAIIPNEASQPVDGQPIIS